MTVNLIKTVAQGNLIKNEETEALSEMKAKEIKESGHRWIEHKPVQMLVLATIAILIGTVVELVPTFLVKSNVPTIASVKPYTPLELTGRDIYVREGCYNCHSQMIRPFRSETERYGEYSKAGEFVYDHPFQWGSKRTGPDLAREGVIGRNYKPDLWHFNHLIDPQKVSPASVMPKYPWLAKHKMDLSLLERKIRAMQKMGVPYPEGYDKKAREDLLKQAEKIATGLNEADVKISADKEIIAVIAYLQRLGTDITKPVEKEQTKTEKE